MKRIGFRKAKVAVARKLPIILHRMWRDETTAFSTLIRRRPLTPSWGGPSPYRGENSGSDRHINIKESLSQTPKLENGLE